MVGKIFRTSRACFSSPAPKENTERKTREQRSIFEGWKQHDREHRSQLRRYMTDDFYIFLLLKFTTSALERLLMYVEEKNRFGGTGCRKFDFIWYRGLFLTFSMRIPL